MPKQKKTLIQHICREGTGFSQMFQQMEQKVLLPGLSKSTLYNYGRTLNHLQPFSLPPNNKTGRGI